MPRGLEAAKIPDMNHTKANDIYWRQIKAKKINHQSTAQNRNCYWLVMTVPEACELWAFCRRSKNAGKCWKTLVDSIRHRWSAKFHLHCRSHGSSDEVQERYVCQSLLNEAATSGDSMEVHRRKATNEL